MTTFDLADVRGFAADLDAGMNRCDDGEGKECPTLDDVLRHYAGLCSEFSDQVRRWGDAVFSGRSKFDPEVERVFRGEGRPTLRPGIGDIDVRPSDGCPVVVPVHVACRSARRPLGPRAAAQRMGNAQARRRAGCQAVAIPGAGGDRGRAPEGRVAAAAAGELGAGRPAIAGALSKIADILTGATSRAGRHSLPGPGMSDLTPIRITPITIGLDFPQFEEICAWPFADSYVRRLLREDIPQRVQRGTCRIWVYVDPDGQLVGFGTIDVAMTTAITRTDDSIPMSRSWP